MRRPVAWIVTVVLLAEAFGVAALNWFLGVLVDRQKMSLAGLDPHVMSTSSKIGGVAFGLYFALCALVAALVAIRDRAPAGFGRILLISAAVVHGLLGAFALSLVSWKAFLFMMVVLGLIVLLLMTYDRQAGPEGAAPGAGQDGDPEAEAGPAAAPGVSGAPGASHSRTDEPQDGDEEPQDSVPAQVTRTASTTP
ncbi:hypothetical protein ACIHEJ_26370 [Streptomyces sp. NPDC052301]|uniref:hypothetical protein n=1 Tax=Streptomyces sp. NPDC052301 TaxID=3365687 RepID=UPI0037D1D273